MADPDPKALFQSAAVESILGYRPKDLVDKNAFDYVHPADLLEVSGGAKNAHGHDHRRHAALSPPGRLLGPSRGARQEPAARPPSPGLYRQFPAAKREVLNAGSKPVTDPLKNITAVISAGGKSRRFGRDKALEPLAGYPLIQHVAASLGGFPHRLILCSHDRYDFLGWPRALDLIEAKGPLGGLYTAIHHSATPWLAFAAADMPFLTADYWRVMAGFVADASVSKVTCQAVIARGPDGRLQPLAGLYHRSLLPSITTRLQAGGAGAELSLLALLKHAIIDDAVYEVPWEALLAQAGGQAHYFYNINTQGDLHKALLLKGQA
ncbi:MAG: NTP transferase domain-containing protein [Deinococcota bacterium]|nr:NTP transferase domain-containing protein [Deinococcota bacterium]